MSDADDSTSGVPSLRHRISNLPRTVVEVVEPAMVVGEVKLADGTILKLRVIINAVERIDGLQDESGKPVYQVQSLVIPSVKATKE